MTDGWIKIHRKITDWEWFCEEGMLVLLMHILINANYEDRKWCGLTIRRGQMFCSTLRLANQLKSTRQRIRTGLRRLEECGVITCEHIKRATNQGMLITVCNYDTYQCDNSTSQPTSNLPLTNIQPTSNHLLTTPKEIKEGKKERNNIELQQNTNVFVDNSLSAAADVPTATEKKSEINWEGLRAYFNAQMKGKSIAPITRMTEKRKKAINARVREYGKESIAKAIVNAAESEFLNGRNSRGWVASFDWIFLPNNFAKVIDGNYNRNTVPVQSTDIEREERIKGYARLVKELADENNEPPSPIPDI